MASADQRIPYKITCIQDFHLIDGHSHNHAPSHSSSQTGDGIQTVNFSAQLKGKSNIGSDQDERPPCVSPMHMCPLPQHHSLQQLQDLTTEQPQQGRKNGRTGNPTRRLPSQPTNPCYANTTNHANHGPINTNNHCSLESASSDHNPLRRSPNHALPLLSLPLLLLRPLPAEQPRPLCRLLSR